MGVMSGVVNQVVKSTISLHVFHGRGAGSLILFWEELQLWVFLISREIISVANSNCNTSGTKFHGTPIHMLTS